MDKIIPEKRIPLAEQKRLRTLRIKAMYRSGFSMDDIVEHLHVSKSTVFFTLNRSHATGKKANL